MSSQQSQRADRPKALQLLNGAQGRKSPCFAMVLPLSSQTVANAFCQQDVHLYFTQMTLLKLIIRNRFPEKTASRTLCCDPSVEDERHWVYRKDRFSSLMLFDQWHLPVSTTRRIPSQTGALKNCLCRADLHLTVKKEARKSTKYEKMYQI